MRKKAKELLGNQLWVEPTDSTERVEYLVKTASQIGLGWLRIFLIWPWIEANPEEWDFRVFDDVFNMCEKYGIKVKATLTANSGPWHIGTPSSLHSHTGFIDPKQETVVKRYVEKCVHRYAHHPALGQWILWNEPVGGDERNAETQKLWHEFLADRYSSISSLNRRWRTGYQNFGQIPFAEDVTHKVQDGLLWRSYRPHLDDCFFRSHWLVIELTRIKKWVRAIDIETDICVNPVPLLESNAKCGVDQEAIANVVDVLGASYHPTWNFTWAPRSFFPVLMSAGIKKQAAHPSATRVEVTEVQTGNTLNSAHKPCAVEPSEIARFYLAGIFAGAESASGWLFNARSYDFEAGDWGLLDDRDFPSPRSDMMRKIHDRLEVVLSKTGGWKPAPTRAFIAWNMDTEALEKEDTRCEDSEDIVGRSANDGSLGTAMINSFFMQQGVDSAITRVEDLPSDGQNGDMIFLSHLVACEAEQMVAMLTFVKTGGTLVFDATTGRKDSDATLHRPWPGGIAKEIGLEAAGLETNPQGYDINILGNGVGKWLLTRMIPDFQDNAGWRPWSDVRFAYDGQPCIWERSYGKGRVVFINGMFGPTILHEPSSHFIAQYVIEKLTADIFGDIRPLQTGNAGYSLHNHCPNGRLTAIIADPIKSRNGNQLYITATPGTYEDLWTGEQVEVPASGEVGLTAEEGIVLLWSEN